MASREEKSKLQPLDYAVYGVLCAAKWETGPEGARRLFRIGERINYWYETELSASLVRLMLLDLVRELPENEFGFVYYEAIWPVKK